MQQDTPYDQLTPDLILEAVESTGLISDGRMLALNSYENRVYQVGIEGGMPVIAKFYRPGRWSGEQIAEEHEFTLELAAAEIPAIPPLVLQEQTLHVCQDFRFAVFERQGGYAPELDNKDTLLRLGRHLGRIHAVSSTRPFRFRPALTVQRFGRDSISTLVEGNWIPAHLDSAFTSLCNDLMIAISHAYQRAGEVALIRLHGDCHPGNILWREGPWFVDMDDCQSGPAIQDLWMLLSGRHEEMESQLGIIMEGYQQFHRFDHRELHLIEALRTLRMLHHAAWIARRWNDPAFPLAFPWFDENNYWEQLILSLREQQSALQELPLKIW